MLSCLQIRLSVKKTWPLESQSLGCIWLSSHRCLWSADLQELTILCRVFLAARPSHIILNLTCLISSLLHKCKDLSRSRSCRETNLVARQDRLVRFVNYCSGNEATAPHSKVLFEPRSCSCCCYTRFQWSLFLVLCSYFRSPRVDRWWATRSFHPSFVYQAIMEVLSE